MAFMFPQPQQAMTPEGISRQRMIANALMQQGMDASPVQHWSQGLNRVAQALLGGYKGNQAEQAAMTLQKQEEAKAAAARAEVQRKAAEEAMLPDWKVVGNSIYDMNPRRNKTPLQVSQLAQKTDEMTAYQKAQLENQRRRLEMQEARQGKPGAIPNAVRTKSAESEVAASQIEAQLDAYKDLVTNKSTGTGNAVIGQQADAIKTARTGLQMAMKDAYELGAITGPDMQILNDMLVDPTVNMSGLVNPFSEGRGPWGTIAGEIGGKIGMGTGITDRVSANVDQVKAEFKRRVDLRRKAIQREFGGAAPQQAYDGAPQLDGSALAPEGTYNSFEELAPQLKEGTVFRDNETGKRYKVQNGEPMEIGQ